MDVGGSFGANWIASTGNKNIFNANVTGLWSWGMVPLGNMLQNGKLVSTGDAGGTLIYPDFVTNPTVLVGNKSLSAPQNNPRGLTQAELTSPYLQQDPWSFAQETGQPILI